MDALQFDLKNKQLSLVQLPIPSITNDDEVLIKIAYAGICGSDLHLLTGSYPMGEKIILGHEFSGIVQSVGSRVRHLKSGDKVAIDPIGACGTCQHCTDSNYHYCEYGEFNYKVGRYRDGGLANYCVVRAYQVFKLPQKISLEQGALAEPLSCVSHGWDRIQPIPVGKEILILGAGIIGNLWASVLHLQGHRKVVVSEPQEGRRKLIANLNTGYDIITPTELKARKSANPKWGVDLVVDTSGHGPATEEGLEYLNSGGQLCVFGVTSPTVKISVSPYWLFKKELTIKGIHVNPYSFNKSLGFIDAMGDRYLDYEKLGIKIYSLKDYQEALAALKSGSIAKAIFKIL